MEERRKVAEPTKRVELSLPGTSSDDLRTWAASVVSANPISGTAHTEGEVHMEITDHPFMGVELTLMRDERRLLTITLFADRPSDEERLVLDAENVAEVEL